MLIDLIKPHEINGFNRIRLGNPHDGGYVIPYDVISKIDYCLTLGVGPDISFELDLFKMNPNIEFHLYDHTVGSLPNNFINEKFKFEKLQVSDITSNNSICIEDILDKTNNRNSIVKCDIEGSEFKVFDRNDINFQNVLIFVLELHNISWNYKKSLSLLDKISKNFETFHTHGNNYCQILFKEPSYNNIIPDVLELTFVNKNIIHESNISNLKFPIADLDFPNNPNIKDFELDFRSTLSK